MEVFVVNRSALTPLRSSGTKPAAVEPTSGPKAPRDTVQLSDESKKLATTELSPEDKEKVAELKARDQEVRTHEQAHIAASGGHAKGQPTYEFEKGPDGRNYAVGGHVDIDTSPVKGDPEATAAKMRTIRRAALAPAEPSSQDRKVAAEASAQEQEALREVAEERQAEVSEGAPTSETGETAAAATQVAAGAPAEAAEPTRADDAAPEVGLASASAETPDTAFLASDAAPRPGAVDADAGLPRTERQSPSNPPAETGAEPPEAARAPDLEVSTAKEPEGPPNPRTAFAFNALQQALAIR